MCFLFSPHTHNFPGSPSTLGPLESALSRLGSPHPQSRLAPSLPLPDHRPGGGPGQGTSTPALPGAELQDRPVRSPSPGALEPRPGPMLPAPTRPAGLGGLPAPRHPGQDPGGARKKARKARTPPQGPRAPGTAGPRPEADTGSGLGDPAEAPQRRPLTLRRRRGFPLLLVRRRLSYLGSRLPRRRRRRLRHHGRRQRRFHPAGGTPQPSLPPRSAPSARPPPLPPTTPSGRCCRHRSRLRGRGGGSAWGACRGSKRWPGRRGRGPLLGSGSHGRPDSLRPHPPAACLPSPHPPALARSRRRGSASPVRIKIRPHNMAARRPANTARSAAAAQAAAVTRPPSAGWRGCSLFPAPPPALACGPHARLSRRGRVGRRG